MDIPAAVDRRPEWIKGEMVEKQALKGVITFLDDLDKKLDGVNATTTLLADLLKPLTQFEVGGVSDFRPDYDKPLNQAAVFLAHNAYNLVGTGATSILPNQSLTLTEMLAKGVRAFELDVHEVDGKLLLCHRVCNASVWSGLDLLFGANRKLSDALGEIGSFIQWNPNEVVMVKLEDHLADKTGTGLAKLLTDTFGEQKIFTGAELSEFLKDNKGAWPSLGELADKGRNLIFTTEHLVDPNPLFVNTPHSDAFSPFVYSSVHQAVSDDLQGLTPTPFQLAEVGEDKTPIIGDIREVWGHLPGVSRAGGGKFTKEQIDQLRAQASQGKGGYIIDLDHLEKDDYRVQEGDYGLTTMSGLLVNLKENGYIFVPAALLAGVLGAAVKPGDEANFTKKILSESTSLAIQLLAYATLPASGRFLYETAKGVATEYKASSQAQIEAKMKEVDEGIVYRWGKYLGRGLVSAADVTARMLLTQGVQALRQSAGYASEDSVCEATTHAVVDSMIANTIITGAESTAKYLWRKVWSGTPREESKESHAPGK